MSHPEATYSVHGRRRALLLGALVALAVLPGCESSREGGATGPDTRGPKGDTTTTPSGPPLTMRVPVDTVRPGMLLEARIAGAALPATVSGALAGQALTLARDSDSTLVAFVPELPAGTAMLTLTIGGRAAQAPVQVRPAVSIADPRAELTRFADALARRYTPTTPPAGFAAADWSRMRTIVDSLDRELRVAIAAATPAEQLAAARYLASRQAGEAGGLASASVPFVTPDRCNGALDRLTSQGINVLGNLAGIKASEVLSVRLRNFVALGEHFDGVYDWIVGMATFPVDCAAAEILETQPPATSVVDQGGILGVTVMATIRALDGSRSQDPLIASYTRLIERVIAAVRALPAMLRSLLDRLPARVQDLPARPTWKSVLEATRLRIVSVVPSTVTVSGESRGTELLLRPSTTATTATDFTVTLAHADDATLRTTVRGTVRPAAAPVVVTVTPATITLAGAGTERELRASATGTANTGFNWQSNDSRVVTVVGTPSGSVATIRAQNPGTTTVRVVSLADPTKPAFATVVVTSGIGITVTPSSATLRVGESQPLTATLTGTHSTGVLWRSSNDNIASVDLTGRVTARAIGTATITATAALDLSVSTTVAITVTSGADGTATALTSGTAVTALNGTAGSQRLFTIAVPAGATSLAVRTSGGSGDVDLYLRRGAPPTASAIDCASEEPATTESCTIANPAAATWYILLLGYEAYSGVTLTASVTTGDTSGGNAQCVSQWMPVLTSVREWSEAPPAGSAAARYGWAFTSTQLETRIYYRDGDVSTRVDPYVLEAATTSPTGCRLSFRNGSVLLDILGLSGNTLSLRAADGTTRRLTR